VEVKFTFGVDRHLGILLLDLDSKLPLVNRDYVRHGTPIS
jgi:hypothetical protein